MSATTFDKKTPLPGATARFRRFRRARKVQGFNGFMVSTKNKTDKPYMPQEKAVEILAKASVRAYSQEPTSDYSDEDWSFV